MFGQVLCVVFDLVPEKIVNISFKSLLQNLSLFWHYISQIKTC